jgi:excisionase family DNA binding protein
MKSCDQLLLPFAVSPEIATVENHSSGASEAQRRRSPGNLPMPGDCGPDQSPPPMRRRQTGKRKSPRKERISPDTKLLVGREEAAEILSLSIRSIDYLLASKELPFRKIGTRTMIPLSALHAFARMHHPERIAS